MDVLIQKLAVGILSYISELLEGECLTEVSGFRFSTLPCSHCHANQNRLEIRQIDKACLIDSTLPCSHCHANQNRKCSVDMFSSLPRIKMELFPSILPVMTLPNNMVASTQAVIHLPWWLQGIFGSDAVS